jgi:hypothetical protein
LPLVVLFPLNNVGWKNVAYSIPGFQLTSCLIAISIVSVYVKYLFVAFI